MEHPDRLFLDFQSALAGRYSLEREVGRGGMGVVYLAREVRLDRPVAIKLLPPSKTADPKLRERFLREARTAAKLSHPNVISIHAVEETGGFVFFAMAYVEGETLTERVRRRGPLPPSEAARILRDVAWALAYAHGQGVVHRDVKPDNILIEQGSGRVLVADFGIAGVVAGAGALVAGEVVGTPEFMSPEQALGEAVDARSDLYSLGVVGYFALSGTLPFEAAKATDVLAKQVTEAAPPLASAAPGVPRRLAQAIDRCLAKDPADRPDGTATLAEQLSHALEQRRELPVALRAFVKHDARLDGGGVDSEFWGRLWTGRLGRWLFGIARPFAGAKAIPASLTHRPTELSIGMAAEQLYESLPKETQRQLRDLPDVVHRLEDDAQRTRHRLEELQEALGDAGRTAADPTIGARHDRILADLTAERELVPTRLADCVAALETIRLNLLRLHARTGSVQSLTTDLGLAREVAKEIGLLLEGQRVVEEELGR